MNVNEKRFIGHEQAKGDNPEDNKCPKCGLKWQYLSGQRYCPTCDYDNFFPDDNEPCIISDAELHENEYD